MTPHFHLKEFERSRIAKDLNIDNSVPKALLPFVHFTMAGMERVRAFLGFPILVTSGYRCPELNVAVGGALTSQHMMGKACDFICPAFGSSVNVAKALAPMVKVLGIDQLILEHGWVHVSFSLNPRYSVLTNIKGELHEGIIG